MQDEIRIIKALFPKAKTQLRNPQTLLVSSGGFHSPAYLNTMMQSIKDALPNSDVYIGQGGSVEGLIVVRSLNE